MRLIRRCEACECPIPDGYPSYWADTQMCAMCAVSIVANERDGLAKQLRGAVDALREWLAASDGLKAVDTSDGEAIRSALDRVDAAKAVARRIGGQ